MPPPRSRRLRNREKSEDVPAPAAPPPVAEDLEIADPDPSAIGYASNEAEAKADTDVAVEPSNRSSRRRNRRGDSEIRSRRTSRVKPLLSPEERAARRQAILRGIKITVLILVGLTALTGLAIGLNAVFRPELIADEVPSADENTPERVRRTRYEIAKQRYELAGQALRKVEQALRVGEGNPEKAEEARQRGERYLIHETLGNAASEQPDPRNPLLGDYDLAVKAFQLKTRLRGFEEQIISLRNQHRARNEKRKIDAQMAKITEVNESALDGIQEMVDKYMQNPVEPSKGGEGADRLRTQFKVLIDEVGRNLAIIAAEKQRRVTQRVTTAYREVESQVRVEVEKACFGAALKLVDQGVRTHPTTDFAGLRKHVEGALTKAWAEKRTSAITCYEDFKAAGTSSDIRRQRLVDAIKLLQDVVDVFGADVPLVQEKATNDAQKMLADYKAELGRLP